jgi:hypothetical protein
VDCPDDEPCVVETCPLVRKKTWNSRCLARTYKAALRIVLCTPIKQYNGMLKHTIMISHYPVRHLQRLLPRKEICN